GFLRYNFNPATIFLGDSGSLFLGFMAAALSLAGSQKGSTIVAIAIPLVSFGLPVIEVGLSLARRFLCGQPLFRGDRGHIHHMLLQRGLTQRQAVILLYAVCAIFSLFGSMLLNPKRDTGALIFFVLAVIIIFGVQHLRYAEFSELGSQILQEVARRRRALAVNSRVRYTADGLSIVRTADEFFCALDEMLSMNEFDCAILELRSSELPLETQPLRYQRQTAGECTIAWSWERGGKNMDKVLGSDQFWSLRVPLSDRCGKSLGAITFYRRLFDGVPSIDIGQICGNLQRELSATIVRLQNSPGPTTAQQKIEHG
ncbi:MAG: undecaprenyl/decaprenyl-phosphate alpha-N-acetylglucosaminyl 1-phosphate transferase, partial [Blastocatellia bacterium]|nr:undecaprenyl/decaprenyl-phosphate alpha-N-acetylglucosaminyl 1-phosphate transferase [Blastocatellia bacterium]